MASVLLQFRHTADSQHPVSEPPLRRLRVHAGPGQPRPRVPADDARVFRRGRRSRRGGSDDAVRRLQDAVEHTGKQCRVTTGRARPRHCARGASNLPAARFRRVFLRHDGARCVSDSVDRGRVGGVRVFQIRADERMATR